MWVDAILDNIPLDIVNQLVLSRLTRQLFMYGSATVGFEASVDLKLRLALVDNGSDDLDHHGVVLRQLPLSGVTELTSG
ncbi:hypothetical protein NADFUDRAFT_80993 [Nadsonia fulvescens var. elongata DSM 6958]|uniref:Uncharacterized protein n=1 Tax=Nadsonia fulvescens var. elongata DSM 6958 TaxID=857566 RepID=A0A1E3PRH5_9ASCO|nr:hypothetical protein NADFUDRAFT_80993 [Nadsonia fulvescens var. elongata DSM 6958]